MSTLSCLFGVFHKRVFLFYNVHTGLNSTVIKGRVTRSLQVKISSGAELEISQEPPAESGHCTQSSTD